MFGADNYQTLVNMSLVASIHDAAGRCRDALPIARIVRERMAGRYGEDKQATLIETGNLGMKEYDCGDAQAGLDYLHRADIGLRQHFGEDNVAAHSFRYALARILLEQHRYRDAQAASDGLSVKALAAGDSAPGWEHRLNMLRGEILIGLGKRQDGRQLIDAALPPLIALGTEDPADISRWKRLARGEPPLSR